jgi:hypothetical protein
MAGLRIARVRVETIAPEPNPDALQLKLNI